MHGYLTRVAEKELTNSLKRSPAVAILGPRQCGKSTMAKSIVQGQDAYTLICRTAQIGTNCRNRNFFLFCDLR